MRAIGVVLLGHIAQPCLQRRNADNRGRRNNPVDRERSVGAQQYRVENYLQPARHYRFTAR